jgi:hypothetical protein
MNYTNCNNATFGSSSNLLLSNSNTCVNRKDRIVFNTNDQNNKNSTDLICTTGTNNNMAYRANNNRAYSPSANNNSNSHDPYNNTGMNNTWNNGGWNLNDLCNNNGNNNNNNSSQSNAPCRHEQQGQQQ